MTTISVYVLNSITNTFKKTRRVSWALLRSWKHHLWMIIPILILAVEKMKNKRQDVDMEKLHCMMMPNRFRFLQAEKPLDEKSGKLLVFFTSQCLKLSGLLKCLWKLKKILNSQLKKIWLILWWRFSFIIFLLNTLQAWKCFVTF